MKEKTKIQKTLLYVGDEGEVSLDVIVDPERETFWATQKTMADLFGVDRSVITKHLKNIYVVGELIKSSTCAKIAHVQQEGNREVKRQTTFYNLDAIISVGYRVNSKNATHFRIWATGVLKEFMVKGFVLDDELLKNGTRFGKDYFDELLERIREIRSSERRVYEKVTDIFATSFDYNPNAEITIEFFKNVQSKLHYAVSGLTPPEIIKSRANSEKINQTVTSYYVKSRNITKVMGPITTFLINLGNITVYIAGIYFLIANEIHLGTLLAIIMYGQLLTNPIKKLSTSMDSIETAFSSIKRIFAIIDYQKEK
jgi:hypothetical protein